MTTQESAVNQWMQLATASDGEREPKMLERYVALAALSEDERRTALQAMARAEYGLSDAVLRPFTKSRLRVWLRMDRDAARKLSVSYDWVMNQMSATDAMRRVGIAQPVTKEFTEEEQTRLHDLVPALFSVNPKVVAAAPPAQSASRAASQTKKNRWAFWKSA